MESIAMVRYKRKELSFTSNSARGLNYREDRLLKSALGTIEKDRQKSLNALATAVQDIHVSLKETISVQKHDIDLELVDVAGQEDKTHEEVEHILLEPDKSEKDVNTKVGQLPIMKDTMDLSRERPLSRRHRLSYCSSPIEIPHHHDNTTVSRLVTSSPVFTRRADARSKSTENISADRSPSCEPLKLFHKRNLIKRTISAENLIPVSRQPLPTRRVTVSGLGTPPTPSTPRQRRHLTHISADSSPLVSRKTSGISNAFPRHPRVSKMVSCPNLSQNTSLNGEKHLVNYPITGFKADLPEISRDSQLCSQRQETSQTGFMSVSPKETDGSLMDKNLQKRINAFLESLPGNHDNNHSDDENK